MLGAGGLAAAEQGGAGGESILLDEIPSVFAASRYDQKASEAPANISIITRDEIRQQGFRTLDEILESFAGLFVNYDRNYAFLAVRGVGRPSDFNSRVLLLLDGRRLNEPSADTGSIGTEAIVDVDLIERVEVIRGPGSSLYGTNALLGVINIVTRRGRDLQGGEISGQGGSQDTFKGRASYGHRLSGGGEFLMSASGYRSAGDARLYFPEFDDPATNNGVAENLDDDRFASGFARGAYRDFTFEGALVNRTKQVPTASYETIFNDPREETMDRRGTVALGWDHELGSDRSVAASVTYDTFYYTGHYPYPTSMNRDFQDSTWWTGNAQYVGAAGRRNKVIAGMEFRYGSKVNQKAWDETPYAVYFDDRRTTRDWAVFAQDEILFHPKVRCSVGVRFDEYDTFGSTINPRLAVVWGPDDKTSIKLLYGTAFRAPNAFELYYQDGQTQKPNTDLLPETLSNIELSLERVMAGRVRGSISFYRFTMDRLINQVTDPNDGLIFFDNTDGSRSRGVEIELSGQLGSRVEGWFHYALQESESTDTATTLTNSPSQTGSLGVTVTLTPEKLFLSLRGQGTSRRVTTVGGEAAGFAVWSTTLRWTPGSPKLWISASLYNIFDRQYGEPGGDEHIQNTIPQDGRTGRIQIGFEF